MLGLIFSVRYQTHIFLILLLRIIVLLLLLSLDLCLFTVTILSCLSTLHKVLPRAWSSLKTCRTPSSIDLLSFISTSLKDTAKLNLFVLLDHFVAITL